MSHDERSPEPHSASECPTLELQRETERGPWTIELGSPTHSRFLTLEQGVRVVLGSGASADARVDDRTVSARHVRVEISPAGVRVEDLDSRNGLYVGGARVPSAWLFGTAASFVIGRTTVTVRARGGFAAPEEGEPLAGLVGESLPMRRLAAEVRRCAALRAPVLLQGESGSGKDVVARALHEVSGRSGEYVPLNVGAIPEALADAELFGHCRGAFTGAVSARPGAFEQAHGGTLFLDEIADLPPSIQVKLLRVVEERRVRPIGGAQSVDVDVRVVSATWAPLDERAAAGRFRADLLHRISTFVIRLPPLRARKSDIPALARVILERLFDEVGPKALSGAALARLVEHDWPGNVRELGSVLYRGAAAASGTEIAAHDIDAALAGPQKTRPPSLTNVEASQLLEEYSGNVSAAARAVGVARSTFRTWLARSP